MAGAIVRESEAGWPLRVPRGFRVGHYEVVAPIAAGSWGSVYAGRRISGAIQRGSPARAETGGAPPPQPDTEVALKFLPAKRLTPGQRTTLDEIVRREIGVAGRWAHPNLVAVHQTLIVDDPESPELDGALVIVMERARTNLRDLLADASAGLPTADARRILAGILAGLEHLHTTGWVHGDLKPGNILLTEDGTAKLADFGLASELDGTHAYLPQAGTTDYLPPEWWTQYASVSGVPTRVTTDIWAFGVTAHQVLTGGRLPFPGATGRARAAAVAEYADGTEPLRLAADLPDDWRRIIADCLAPTHIERLAHTAGSLRARVYAAAGQASSGVPSAATQPRGQAVARLPEPRGRFGWGLSPLVFLLLLTLTASTAAPVAMPTSGGWLRPGAAVPRQYWTMIEQAADTYPNQAITPSLVAAIVATQSGFNPNARTIGVDGSAEYGIAGWTPRVYADFAVDAVGDGHPTYLNPKDAIYSLVRQLAWDDDNLGALPGDRALLLAAAYHTSVKYVTNTDGKGANCATYVARVRSYLRDFTDPAHGTVPSG